MESIHSVAGLIGDVIVILGVFGVLLSFYKKLKLIALGQQCQLRSDITKLYYSHCDRDEPTLREFERKNLDDLYDAYKALKGNHYIDDLYTQMRGWKVAK